MAAGSCARGASGPGVGAKPGGLVVSAGAPIEEVIARLTAVQAEHPGAQIRQGKQNRWEIWPPGH
jgi:hypothetical protein